MTEWEPYSSIIGQENILKMQLDKLRRSDCVYILQRIADGDCCAVVGVSNTGKSTLLRAIARPGVRQDLLEEQVKGQVFVYVDFN